MIETLAVAGYRSLRSVLAPLDQLNAITGPNGSGKSSVYRALRLLAQVGSGNVVRAVAGEGGFASALWAGPEQLSRAMRDGAVRVEGTRSKKPRQVRLGFGGADFGYALCLGQPPSDPVMPWPFDDPQIKREVVFGGSLCTKASMLADRRGPAARVRGEEGWRVVAEELSPFESMVATLADPDACAPVFAIRRLLDDWRFYDGFRADRDAPARQPQVATYTPVMSHDGSDVAAALTTQRMLDDAEALDAAIEDAFEGARLEVMTDGSYAELAMRQPGMLRPLRAAELSEGTLRYALWVVALFSPRPSTLMVLNEPEASLHPSLLEPLGRLIAAASERTQLVVVTHSQPMIRAMTAHREVNLLQLDKNLGETRVTGQGLLDTPAWQWP